MKRLMRGKKAVELATVIYEITTTFPKEELFGIVSQLRRAAISISSNIAEGYGRKSLKVQAIFRNIFRFAE